MVKLHSDETIRGDGLCVAVAGEVDAHTALEMRAALLAAVSRHQGVTVDLAAVTFMDSQGLAVLLRARQESESHGGSLRLERVPARVMKLLRITALEAAFIIDSVV